MEGYCSTGQSPHWAVVPMEKEEEEYTKPRKNLCVVTAIESQNSYRILLRGNFLEKSICKTKKEIERR